MSDLISRSQLLKEIETWGGCVEALHEYIQNMPTAYDIDKVVERLNRETISSSIKESIGLLRAIEIVKQGCVSDDVCEWKSTQINNEWKPSCEPNSTYNVFGVAWFKRCPYCGKKIKVVE